MVLTQALHTVLSSGDYYRAVGRYENLGVPVFSNVMRIRVRPRFFDQVGHKTMHSSSGNKNFSINRQTYQNYEQRRQQLGAISENKVP